MRYKDFLVVEVRLKKRKKKESKERDKRETSVKRKQRSGNKEAKINKSVDETGFV